jgi:hypothetical protein
MVVSIIDKRDDSIVATRKWYSDGQELRTDSATIDEIKSFLKIHRIKNVVNIGKIIGCPHDAHSNQSLHGSGPQRLLCFSLTLSSAP